MRLSLAATFAMFGLAASASSQTCTGLCLQQVTCTGTATTTISGVVYAPNGIDPLPNVLVYIPNAPVDAFTAGVSCPVVGAPPSGSPLVGAQTANDGSFQLPNVPVGTNIPIVIQSGRWRRQVVVPNVTACVDNAFSTRFPQNQTEGDIPKIAVATGGADAVECVLRRVGISDSEFTDPSGSGRVNFYLGSGAPGALIDRATPSQATLMGDSSILNSYDVLMLPCEGTPNNSSASKAADLANLVAFANAGGRVYASHYSYVWLYQNAPFNTVANWTGISSSLPDGIATVDTTFSQGQTLSKWLQLVGASTTPGQIAVSTLRQDLRGVNKPTQSWLTLNNPAAGNPVMQFVFDTPVGAVTNQCGRVLFNEYHVETPAPSSTGKAFPAECGTGPMTPQEKLLEFSLFELTNDGGAASLTPTAQDFGTQAVGFNSPVQTFKWTNNSTFFAGVNLLNASGDFNVVGNNCSSVGPGFSCNINVVFNPTVIGPRTGTLTVGSGASTLISTLTGIGIPDLIFSFSALDFGNLDVGARLTRQLIVTNSASGAVPAPVLNITGDFSVSSGCGTTVSALSSCSVNVTFSPTVSGPRTGSLTVQTANPGSPTSLTGNGLDYTIVANPSSGSVVAGLDSSTTVTVAPLGGFGANVKLTCTVAAPGSTCIPDSTGFAPSSPFTTNVHITTTSQYTVVGYSGFGGGWLCILGLGSGLALWFGRRRTHVLLRAGLVALLIGAASVSLTGCSGKLPAQNANYTAPGSYAYTLTASDGFLSHSATYTLTVKIK